MIGTEHIITGMRPSEEIALEVDDFDLTQGKVGSLENLLGASREKDSGLELD